jgi:hypothetical protein
MAGKQANGGGGGALSQAVEALAEGVRRGAPDRELHPHLLGIQRHAAGASAAERDGGVRRLAEVAGPSDLPDPGAGVAALFGCGLLIEAGADPAPAADIMLGYARVIVPAAAHFQRALRAAWEKAEAAEGELDDQRRRAIVEEVGRSFPPEEIYIGNLFHKLSPALLALLLRSKEARRQARALGGFADDLRAFEHFGHEPEAFVGRVLEEAAAARGLRGFALLAPEWASPPRYLLFVESDAAPVLARDVEERLRESVQYDYCRRLGQLGPVEGVRVVRGGERYLDGCAALGQRPGGVKPAYLRREFGWRARLEATYAG